LTILQAGPDDPSQAVAGNHLDIMSNKGGALVETGFQTSARTLFFYKITLLS
jgi:hypothetical protein